MSQYEEFDPERLRLLPFARVPHTISMKQFATAPSASPSFREFWDSLPDIYAGRSLRLAARKISEARARRRSIVVACGAHVIKCGLSPVLISLMRQGFITALALNGAGAIHDLEIACFGVTSEEVAPGLASGTFGMARETSELYAAAIASAQERGEGAGEALGRTLCDLDAANADSSLLAAAFQLRIPLTVHIAVGTDIVHMHAGADGAALGAASLRDFRILTAAMADLAGGGVLMNIGSAVVLPEVVLKAIACHRNLDPDYSGMFGINLDMLQQYRSNEQVISRVRAIGGDGLALTGHHEIMIPLLACGIAEAWTDLQSADPTAAASAAGSPRATG